MKKLRSKVKTLIIVVSLDGQAGEQTASLFRGGKQ
jgi:hypothetical protein